MNRNQRLIQAFAFPVLIPVMCITMVGIAAHAIVHFNLHLDPDDFIVNVVGIACGVAVIPMLLGLRHEYIHLTTKEALEAHALTDQLTGVLNRRAFHQAVEYERSRMSRTGYTAALILFDLDKFKYFNDRFGHAFGDQVLKEISTLAHHELRGPFDRLGRWGGEEFVVLLTNVTMQQAQLVAERLRKSIETTAVEHKGAAQSVTASFGIAELTSAEAFEDVLHWADKALYEAKDKGRNKVISYGRLPLAA